MSSNLLPRATPESQGIPSRAILDFVETAEREIDELHSLMLLRHGQVLAEGWWAPYAAGRPHLLFSLSKSFTSSAVGLAVAEGRLSLDDPVISFFPEELPAVVSQNLAAMRVKQLLSMCTGHQEDTTGRMREDPDGNYVRGFLALAVEHKPGTHFLYNTGASYMLSAIVQKVTGQTLLTYLGPRLFEPLGIPAPTWESCPRGINMGGFGLSVRTEDIARFGQLYLQRGLWQGRRLLPEAWVAEASARQVSNGSNPQSDWEQGYGYQFWRCRHGAYRGDGAFGQYCVVMPAQDAVLAITGGLADMQAVLNLAWDKLLAAMAPAPLAEDAAGQAALDAKLAGLALPPPAGAPAAALESQLEGRTIRLDENGGQLTAIQLAFSPQAVTCSLRGAQGEMRLACGRGAWVESMAIVPQLGEQRVAASAAWLQPNMLQMTVRLVETPFYQTYRLVFAGPQVRFTARVNVDFGPTEAPELTGRLA